MENQDTKQTTSTSPNTPPKTEKTYEEAFAELRGFIMKTRTEEAKKNEAESE